MAPFRMTFLVVVLAGVGMLVRPTWAGDDTDASRLLDDVAKAYRALPAYADRGELRVVSSVDGEARTDVQAFRLRLIRPNLLKVETDAVALVCDGKTITTTVAATKRFTTAPAPASLSMETFRAGPLGSVLFGGPTEPLVFALVDLLVGEEPVKTLLAELDARPERDGIRKIGETEYALLRLKAASGPDYRLVIDPSTKLLHGIELVVDPKDAGSALPGESVTVKEIAWRAGRIETTVASEEIASFKPPAGYSRIDAFAKAAGPQAELPKNRVEELLGTPAPNFSLTVMDPAGKFQTVTRDDLAGKVVMLDFWATWCGPCLTELPEVQKLIDAYAQDKKDVVVIAVSQDQRPSELGEVRKLVEKTLAEKKIQLTGNAVGKIALDPSGTIGEAFRVEALPTVVILDAKGTVQAAHVGFHPGVRESLTRDIDSLLGGKPLVKPKKAHD